MLGGEGSWPSKSQPPNLSPRYSIPMGRATLTDLGSFFPSESHQAFLAPSLGVLTLQGCCGSPSPGSGVQIPGKTHPATPCFTASASPSQAQLGTTARWTPLVALSPQHLHVDRRTPRDRQLLPPLTPLLLLPKPPSFSSPATSSQLSSSPHLHPHLHPLKDLELPGLNTINQPIALPVAGPFPSLSPLVPHCPFAHT